MTATIDTVLKSINASEEPFKTTDLMRVNETFADYFQRQAKFCQAMGIKAPVEALTEYLAGRYWEEQEQFDDEAAAHGRRARAAEDIIKKSNPSNPVRVCGLLSFMFYAINNATAPEALEQLNNPEPKAELYRGEAGQVIHLTGFGPKVTDFFAKRYRNVKGEVSFEKIDENSAVLSVLPQKDN